jgi:16S rRNA (guanine966-N2)-methyltransferase
MRIIAGKFKKTNLFPVPGNTARPTTDYVKELIFSTIFSCTDNIVLDLFAGSGSLGLEALSRGAQKVFFIEFSNKSVGTVIKNIGKLRCEDKCKVYKRKVSAFLKSSDEKFDLIFMDPPYNKNLINETLEQISDNKLLSPIGKIVVEHSDREKISDKFAEKITKQKKAGNTLITILEL